MLGAKKINLDTVRGERDAKYAPIGVGSIHNGRKFRRGQSERYKLPV